MVAGDHGNNMNDDDGKRDVSQAASFMSATDDNALDFSVSPPTKLARPAATVLRALTPRAGSAKRSGDSSQTGSAGGSKLPVRRKIIGGARSTSAGSPARIALRAPPRPRLGVSEHWVVETAGLQQAEQLAALVQQQGVDHEQFRSIGAAMARLADVVGKQQSTIDDLAEQLKGTTNGGLQLRKELYSVRDTLMGAGGNDMRLELQQRVIGVETAVKTLHEQLKADSAVGTRMAAYLEHLDGTRPQDGHEIVTGFKNVAEAISQVEARVQHFEAAAGHVMTAQPSGIPVTKPMMARLDEMHVKVAQLDNFYGHYNAMNKRVNENSDYIRHMDTLISQLSLTVAEGQGVNLPAQSATTGDHQHAGGGGLGGGFMCGPCGESGIGGGNGGSSGDGLSDAGKHIQAIIGGNGRCHCVHVEELTHQVKNIEKHFMGEDGAYDPWSRPCPGGAGQPPHPTPAKARADVGEHARQGKRSLPLKLRGTLGAIGYSKDRPIFDDRLMVNEDYRYNGVKNGVRWKSKVTSHFISRSPVLKEILEWAEEEDNTSISVPDFMRAVGGALTEEQVLNVNAAIWGFLGGCLHGTAETMFKRATMLNGIDAWRIMARQVDHGRPIRLETLRREVKELHTKPIKTLDNVEEGVAEFENLMDEYHRAGGPAPVDSELKSDLLRILPREIRELLIWHSTNVGVTFQQFRDTVVAQTAQVLLERGGHRSVHALEQQQNEVRNAILKLINGDAAEAGDGDGTDLEELLAAVRKMKGTGRGRSTRTSGAAPPPSGPRKCPNCGKEHTDRKCPHPPVPVDERLCWFCQLKGHTSANCEKRKRAGAVKNLEEPTAGPAGKVLFAVNSDGYTPVRRGNRPQRKPFTIVDFIDKGAFDALGTIEEKGRRTRDRASEKKPMTGAQTSVRPRDTQKGVGNPTHSGPDKTMRELNLEEFDEMLKRELANVEGVLETEHRLQCLTHEESADNLIANAEEVTVEAAVDSGSVDNVINPGEVPDGVKVTPNAQGNHFVGANNSRIENFGTCTTRFVCEDGAEGECGWTMADVSRPLHAVSKLTGTIEAPKQDVLFNAGKCVVVPPGIVDRVLQFVKPLMQYDRKGGLYVAKMKLTDFQRPAGN